MKKWKQVVMLAALAFGVTFAVKTDADAAAQITGVKQIDAGSKNVKVSWDASLGAEHYVIEFSDDQTNWYKMEDTSTTEASVYGLSAGSTYYVRVIGYKDWSWLSETGTVCADASIPVDVVTAPDCSNLTAVQSDAGTTKFSVKFSGAVGADYYQIVYPNNNTEVILGESDSATVTTSVALTPGTSYWSRCYACKKSSSGFLAKESLGYEYVRFRTNTKKVTKSQFGITNAWQNIDSYNFGISSATVGDFDGCEFQFQTSAGKVKKTASTTSSSISVSSFVNGTFYKYRVRTYVECGSKKAYSAWSEFRYVGVAKKVTANGTSNAIKFNWSKVAGATKYDVYMSTNENSGFKKVKTAKAGNRTVSLTKFKGKKIQKGKRYYVKIYSYAKVNGKTVKSDIAWSGYYYRY